MKRKRRSESQILEDRSIPMIRAALPEEWVLHNYAPDYGIDLVVEVFRYLDDDVALAETLGELFFVQAKSSKAFPKATHRVHPRMNVEKYDGQQSIGSDFYDIPVRKFSIELSELATIHCMGSGAPVLLFLIDMSDNAILWVCLNDYIEKVLLPEDINVFEGTTKVIYVPEQNRVSRAPEHLLGIRFQSKRAKLLAAFNKFAYQYSELQYLIPQPLYGDEEGDELLKDVSALVSRFVQVNLALDIWENAEMWTVLMYYHQELKELKVSLKRSTDGEKVNSSIVLLNLLNTWRGLDALGHNFEEMCKEWFLPTHLAQQCSYSKTIAIRSSVDPAPPASPPS